LHNGHKTRAKNTGMALKLLRSAMIPVGMSRPVSGHLIITAPIEPPDSQRQWLTIRNNKPHRYRLRTTIV
jgi:hypothetical protein